VLHFPFLQIVLPANVVTFNEYIIPVAMFDVLENSFGFGFPLIFKFDKDKHESLQEKISD